MGPRDDAGELSGPKERTLRLLREAARQLLRTGVPLTVPAAAELAAVSRATAYGYFPNNDAVVLHATMSLADDPLADTEWPPELRHLARSPLVRTKVATMPWEAFGTRVNKFRRKVDIMKTST
jgi:hypothetical protein